MFFRYSDFIEICTIGDYFSYIYIDNFRTFKNFCHLYGLLWLNPNLPNTITFFTRQLRIRKDGITWLDVKNMAIRMMNVSKDAYIRGSKPDVTILTLQEELNSLSYQDFLKKRTLFEYSYAFSKKIKKFEFIDIVTSDEYSDIETSSSDMNSYI